VTARKRPVEYPHLTPGPHLWCDRGPCCPAHFRLRAGAAPSVEAV